MPPRNVRDPKARERMVDAAATVVAERGVHAATIRAIAAEAGISTGFITHYFADKHQLMLEVLRRNNARAARRVLQASDQGSGLARLRAAVDAVLPFDTTRRREWQVWVAVWGQASPGDELAAGYRAGWTGLREIFADLLEQARQEGELVETIDPTYAAQRLVTLLAGIGLLAGVETPKRVRAAATRMLDEELAALGGAARDERSAA
jgi:AcrR family transcriptional regulator